MIRPWRASWSPLMKTRRLGLAFCMATRPVTISLSPTGFLSRNASPALSTEMLTKSFLVSLVEVVAVGRLTFTLLRFTMLRLTSMNAASRKNMMSIRGMISMRASALSEGSLEPSLTGMLRLTATDYSPQRRRDHREEIEAIDPSIHHLVLQFSAMHVS